jgi:hypothetical protein
MPARESIRRSRELSAATVVGLTPGRNPAPGQYLVNVLSGPRELIVDVMAVVVLEKFRLWSAVDPKGIGSAAPNPLGVKLCRVSGHVISPIWQAAPHRYSQVSGATVWLPRASAPTTNDDCGDNQPE